MYRYARTNLSAVVALVAFAALLATALAANIDVPDTTAGQGEADVIGYEVTNLTYAENPAGDPFGDVAVDEIIFDIEADAGGLPVDGANTKVFVATNGQNFVECEVGLSLLGAPAPVTCDIDLGGEATTLNALEQISIVAYEDDIEL